MKRKNKLILATSWFLIIIIMNYTIPYTILENVEKFKGAFLFWSLLSIVAIISMFVLMSRWRLKNE